MDDEKRAILKQLKVNIEPTINRFVDSEEFYFEMLDKFKEEDKTFDELSKNIEARDFEAAFKDAHTLKGVAANLGLDLINETIKPLTEELRNAPYDEEKILMLYEKSKVLYREGMDLIGQLL